jgi:DnaJ-class molecular chaperone
VRAAIVSDYHATMSNAANRKCTQCDGLGVLSWKQESVPPQPPPAGVVSGTIKCPLCGGTGIMPPDAGDILKQPPTK